MSLWLLLIIVMVFGCIGGFANSIIYNKGFTKPHSEAADKAGIWRPGWLGNCFLGGIAAVISWGLYGPFASAFLVGGPASGSETGTLVPGLSLAAAVGAILVGIGGARWLTTEVDKKLLRATASKVAEQQPSTNIANSIKDLSPVKTLELVSEG